MNTQYSLEEKYKTANRALGVLGLILIGSLISGGLNIYYSSKKNAEDNTPPIQFQAQDTDGRQGLDTLIIEGKEFRINQVDNKLSLLEK